MALNTEMVNEPIPFDSETPADLVFDDDSIESILYEPSPAPPTEASIFTPARRLLEEIRNIQDVADFDDVLDNCNQFLADENPLTPELSDALCEIIVVLSAVQTLEAERQELLNRLINAVGRRCKDDKPPGRA